MEKIRMNRNAKAFVAASEEVYGVLAVIDRSQIQQIVEERGVPYPFWLVTKTEHRVGRGQYRVPALNPNAVRTPVTQAVQTAISSENPVPSETVDAQVLSFRQPKLVDESMPTVPSRYPDYVPFGFYNDLKKIISNNMFYPVFITGLSGNGKTLMVEQVCADLKRECIRVNVSIETDEADLLGGPTLVQGNVVNRDGPVIIAMRRGAVLLIDEVDRGSNKLMCLQGILEGKPYYNKKTGEVIYPTEGFTVIATANTKGRGSDEGKYLSQVLDDAFLERFPITVEQEYPSPAVETKILTPLIEDAVLVKNLVQWADVIRKSYLEGATDEIISTRRLVHIAGTYKIFKDPMKAIELCVARFDTDTKLAFMDLYTKVEAPEDVPVATVPDINPTIDPEIPF
jgi:hypothetical protein